MESKYVPVLKPDPLPEGLGLLEALGTLVLVERVGGTLLDAGAGKEDETPPPLVVVLFLVTLDMSPLVDEANAITFSATDRSIEVTVLVVDAKRASNEAS